MNKNFKMGVIITSLLSILFFIIFYFYKINTKLVRAINVLPQNTVFALEVKNISLQMNVLNQQTFWQQLIQNETIKKANDKLKYFDSITNFETHFKDWKNNENVIVSFHAYPNKTIDELFMVEVVNKIDINELINWIYDTNKSRLLLNKREFSGNTIFDFVDFKTQEKFSIAYKNKIFAISSNGQLIEEVLHNLGNSNNYKVSNLDQLNFVKSLGDYNLYINHKNLTTFLKVFLNYENFTPLINIQKMASWSALGVNMSNDQILLKGVTITHDTTFEYLDCFNNMENGEQSIKNILPINTNYYLGINYSNDKGFKQNLKEYYLVNKIDNRNPVIDSIQKKIGDNKLYENIVSTFGNEVAQINVNNTQISSDSSSLLVIKVKDKLNLINRLEKIATASDTNLLDTSKIKINNLYEVNLSTFFDYTWGDMLLGIRAKYALVYEDYLILSENKILLSDFLNHQMLGQLLKTNPNYVKHLENLKSTSNIDFFINNNNFVPEIENILHPELTESFKLNIGYLKKAIYASFQFGASTDKNYLTSVAIQFNTNSNKNTQLLWEIDLDTLLVNNPQVVYHSSTNQQVIMVQDAKNQLYMINEEGKTLFKLPIAGKIISKIYEVDAFKNGQTQYLFNTNSQIYLIDYSGKNIQGYPLWIPTGTYYPIQVFDYLNDKTYQIFAVGKFYKIWCYNIQAKLQNGWAPKNVYPNLIQNIEGFYYQNDLITYVINEKGKLNFFDSKAKPFNKFGFDSNMTYKYISHVSVDSNKIHFYYIDSNGYFKVNQFNQTKKDSNIAMNSSNLKLIHINNGNYFIAQNNNAVKLFDINGKTEFSKNFNDTFNHQVSFVFKNNSIHLAYVDSLNAKLYLENKLQEIDSKFPLETYFYYCFGRLMNDENIYLITSTKNNKLQVYQIK